MTEAAESFPVIREAVASFPDREHFHRAVSASAGRRVRARAISRCWPRTIRSPPRTKPQAAPKDGLACRPQRRDQIHRAADRGRDRRAVGRADRRRASRHWSGAGLGGAALKELFDDYTAPRHSEDFAAALKAGAALLWVRCEDPDRELAATRILEEAGGHHVHVHGRSPRSDEPGRP